MALTITKGIKPAAVRAVIYGVEGVGKSSLAALLPSPLFLDLEEGTHQLDVARATVDTFAALRSSLAHLAGDAQGFKTVVIDSADWAERMASEALLKGQGKKSIEDFSFGKGFTMLAEEFSRVLQDCDTLIHRGLNVVWIAHAKTVRVSPPDMADGFDRYELKLAKQTSPLLKEWADLLLFANFETIIVKGNDGRVKGEGGKRRLIYAERAAAWDAKNRYGLPEILTLEHGQLDPQLAAVFGAQLQTRNTHAAPAPIAEKAGEEAKGNAGESPAGRSPATAEQVAKLKTYAQNSVCSPIIEKALAHYGEISPDDLTADQAAKVITRCQEEMNKPAESPAATGEPAFLWPDGVAAWLDANAEKANAYFVSKNWIRIGQTFRDLPSDRAETVVLKADKLATAAGIPAMGGAK